mgnify:FL=1
MNVYSIDFNWLGVDVDLDNNDIYDSDDDSTLCDTRSYSSSDDDDDDQIIFDVRRFDLEEALIGVLGTNHEEEGASLEEEGAYLEEMNFADWELQYYADTPENRIGGIFGGADLLDSNLRDFDHLNLSSESTSSSEDSYNDFGSGEGDEDGDDQIVFPVVFQACEPLHLNEMYPQFFATDEKKDEGNPWDGDERPCSSLTAVGGEEELLISENVVYASLNKKDPVPDEDHGATTARSPTLSAPDSVVHRYPVRSLPPSPVSLIDGEAALLPDSPLSSVDSTDDIFAHWSTHLPSPIEEGSDISNIAAMSSLFFSDAVLDSLNGHLTGTNYTFGPQPYDQNEYSPSWSGPSSDEDEGASGNE